MRWLMTDHRVGRCSTVGAWVRVTRTRRTYVIAAAVAAIVTAANASQGAYFSQSWGWVALAFLVPTTVLLILDRVETPGRLRVAFACSDGRARCVDRTLVRCGRSARRRRSARSSGCSCTSRWRSPWSSSSGGATARASWPGSSLGVAVVCGVRARDATLPRPRWRRTTTRLVRTDWPRRSGTGTRSGCSPRSAFSRPSASSPTPGGHGSRWRPLPRCPSLATTLYFTFSRGAWAALVVGFAAMVAFDPRRLRLLWVTCSRRGALRCSQSRMRLASTRSTTRTRSDERRGARASGCSSPWRRSCVCTSRSRWTARHVAQRVPVSRRARRGCDAVASRRRPRSDGSPRLSLLVAPCSGVKAFEGALRCPRRSEPGEPERASVQRLRKRKERAASRRLGRRSRSSARRQRRWLVRVPAGTSVDRTCSSCATPTRCTCETFARARRRRALRSSCCLLLVPVAAGIRARRARLVACRPWVRYFAWAAHSSLRLALGDGRGHVDRASRRSDRAPGRRARTRAVASEADRGSALVGALAVLLSVSRSGASSVTRRCSRVATAAGAQATGLTARGHARTGARRCSSGPYEPESSSATPLPGSAIARRRSPRTGER